MTSTVAVTAVPVGTSAKPSRSLASIPRQWPTSAQLLPGSTSVTSIRGRAPTAVTSRQVVPTAPSPRSASTPAQAPLPLRTARRIGEVTEHDVDGGRELDGDRSHQGWPVSRS